jgi:hypothetical protein
VADFHPGALSLRDLTSPPRIRLGRVSGVRISAEVDHTFRATPVTSYAPPVPTQRELEFRADIHRSARCGSRSFLRQKLSRCCGKARPEYRSPKTYSALSAFLRSALNSVRPDFPDPHANARCANPETKPFKPEPPGLKTSRRMAIMPAAAAKKRTPRPSHLHPIISRWRSIRRCDSLAGFKTSALRPCDADSRSVGSIEGSAINERQCATRSDHGDVAPR